MSTDDYRLDQVERSQLSQTRRRREHRSRRRHLYLLAGLAFIVVLAVGAPSLISHSSIGRSILARSMAAYGLDCASRFDANWLGDTPENRRFASSWPGGQFGDDPTAGIGIDRCRSGSIFSGRLGTGHGEGNRCCLYDERWSLQSGRRLGFVIETDRSALQYDCNGQVARHPASHYRQC